MRCTCRGLAHSEKQRSVGILTSNCELSEGKNVGAGYNVHCRALVKQTTENLDQSTSQGLPIAASDHLRDAREDSGPRALLCCFIKE